MSVSTSNFCIQRDAKGKERSCPVLTRLRPLQHPHRSDWQTAGCAKEKSPELPGGVTFQEFSALRHDEQCLVQWSKLIMLLPFLQRKSDGKDFHAFSCRIKDLSPISSLEAFDTLWGFRIQTSSSCQLAMYGYVECRDATGLSCLVQGIPQTERKNWKNTTKCVSWLEANTWKATNPKGLWDPHTLKASHSILQAFLTLHQWPLTELEGQNEFDTPMPNKQYFVWSKKHKKGYCAEINLMVRTLHLLHICIYYHILFRIL